MAKRREQIELVIERLLREGSAVARKDGSHHDLFPITISAEVGNTLREWVRKEDARVTIEVGLAYGLSALHICAGLNDNGYADATHVAIDPFQLNGPDGVGFAGCALQFLDEAGVASMVEHIEEESQIALPRLVGDGPRFDLGFIDGNHRFERVFLDLYYLGRLVRPGGIIILDDYEFPGIVKAASFFTSNLKWSIEDARTVGPHGWAVLRTSDKEDTRHFTYFVDF